MHQSPQIVASTNEKALAISDSLAALLPKKKGMILPPNSPSAAAAATPASPARRGCCCAPRSGYGIHDILISGKVFVDPILGIIR